jgi:hypothetical protein
VQARSIDDDCDGRPVVKVLNSQATADAMAADGVKREVQVTHGTSSGRERRCVRRPYSGMSSCGVQAQNGVRRHEGRDLREQPATKPVSHFGKASALAVVETQALPGEPGLQQSILFAQERDDIACSR